MKTWPTRVPPSFIVWVNDIFDYYLEIEDDFTKYVIVRVVDNILKNISPSSIFLAMLLPTRSYQNCEAAFGHSENEYVKEEDCRGYLPLNRKEQRTAI